MTIGPNAPLVQAKARVDAARANLEKAYGEMGLAIKLDAALAAATTPGLGQSAESASADGYRRPAEKRDAFTLPSLERLAEYFRRQRPVW